MQIHKPFIQATLLFCLSFALSSCQTATDLVLGKGSYQLMEDMRKISKTKKQYREEIKPAYQTYILKRYPNQLLQPEDVPSINLTNIQTGYSFELLNLANTKVQKHTVASNSNGTIRLSHSIRDKDKNEDLTTYTTINHSGTVIEEPYATVISSYFPIYSPNKCTFVLGECTFTSISTNIKKQTVARHYKTYTIFKNGVWFSKFEVEGKAGFAKIYDSEAIYDKNGFPLFIYQDKLLIPSLLVRNAPELDAMVTKLQAAMTSRKVN